MKNTICTAIGAIGGWSAALTTLVIYMVIDYIAIYFIINSCSKR